MSQKDSAPLNILEDLEVQNEIDQLDLVEERTRLLQSLVDQLSSSWKNIIPQVPGGAAEKQKWTNVFKEVTMDFSQKLVCNLDDENYATLAFKKRLALGLDSLMSRVLPGIKLLNDLYDKCGDDNLADMLQVERLGQKMDSGLFAEEQENEEEEEEEEEEEKEEVVDLTVDTPPKNGRPTRATQKRRRSENLPRRKRRAVKAESEEEYTGNYFEWNSTNKIRLTPINVKSGTICQDAYQFLLAVRASGKSIKTMQRVKGTEPEWLSDDKRSQKLWPQYKILFTRLESILKHVQKEYLLRPVSQRSAQVKVGLSQAVLSPFFDKVINSDEDLAANLMAPYSGGALAIIARAVLDLYESHVLEGGQETGESGESDEYV